jgi:polysaccharide biosynthesis/export protein
MRCSRQQDLEPGVGRANANEVDSHKHVSRNSLMRRYSPNSRGPRRGPRLAAALVAVWALGRLATGEAQSLPTPSEEQIRMFQSLPPDQRNAILQQLGLGGDTTGGAITGAQPAGGGRNQITVETPAGPTDQARGSEGGGERRVQGGDLLLIDLSLGEEAAAPTTSRALDTAPQSGARSATAMASPEAAAGIQQTRSPEEMERLQALRDRIANRNPYELDRDGMLQLPGAAPIPLSGLTSFEIQRRLALDPLLRVFHVQVTLLRVKPTGPQALKPFGYDIFRGSANAFVPGTDIPVPGDYRIGAGDVVHVELYGQKGSVYTLPVDREGSIDVPGLGPVSVGGLSLGSLRSMLSNRVERQLIGTHARITLSDLRSSRVLVVGDAETPGSYIVSGMSTVTNALFASGGVKPIGSLRDIEVKRAGRTVGRLDVYDVLLRGDTANDIRLEAGDAVFIPPVGPTVGVDGEVHRPAIYELAHERTAAEMVRMAGGLTPSAEPRVVTVERMSDAGDHMVLSINLTTAAGRDFEMRSGDTLRVPLLRPVLERSVVLSGYVYRPGSYQFRDGMHLTDILRSVDDVRPRGDLHYVLIRREDPVTRHITVFSADLATALVAPAGKSDTPLAARDRIYVFDVDANRDAVVEPLLQELKLQSRPNDLASVVSVAGRVNVPGDYPLEVGMRVSDLLRAGGGLRDSAYANAAELTRYVITSQGDRRQTELRAVDLGAILRGDTQANLTLEPYDVLAIREMPEWRRVEEIELIGEVRFPGKYRIERGETLGKVLVRAGGLTPLAFPEGAVFTREELREKEREQLDALQQRLRKDLSAIALQNTQTNFGNSQTLAVGQGLLEQLQQTKPVGRLVINLNRIAQGKGHGPGDVTLRNGDRLVVPRATEEVSVVGEVQNPTSHLFQPGYRRDDYIDMSGGYTPRADRKHVYVVQADGSVQSTPAGWLHPSHAGMHAGDTVVVPFDAEKMRALPLWTAVTTIMYNLGIAAAAIGHL